MPPGHTKIGFLLDFVLVGGVVAVLSFASTSAFFLWFDTLAHTAIEQAKPYELRHGKPSGHASVANGQIWRTRQ
jgi:hypothetical protein